MYWIIVFFCRTIAPEACRLRIGVLSCTIWNRVRKFERRFYALYAMWKAGTLPKPRLRRPSPSPLTGRAIAFGVAG
jgi:hypothetical protein